MGAEVSQRGPGRMNYLNELIKALREVFFSLAEIESFLMIQMSLNLNDITPPDALPNVFCKLAFHLSSLGRVEEFIEKVASEKPTPSLKALVANLALVGAGIRRTQAGDYFDPAGNGQTNPVQACVRDLSNGIQARMNLFGYMNATKRLHEIMHGLHREYAVLDMAVQTRMRDVKLPLSRGACGLLEDLISEAEEACRDSEFSEEPPDWIACLQTCLCELMGDQPDNWTGALLELERLPAKEMRPLNDRLVDNASRIGFGTLSDLAGKVLGALSSELSAEWKELQQAVTVFNKRCLRVSSLVKMHNTCQLIDERLAPLRSPFPMAAKLYEWRSVMPRLTEVQQLTQSELAGRALSNDTLNRVSDTFAAALTYQNATGAEDANREFDSFRATFNDLFDTVDKEVLKTCSEICGSINRLADRLKERL